MSNNRKDLRAKNKKPLHETLGLQTEFVENADGTTTVKLLRNDVVRLQADGKSATAALWQANKDLAANGKLMGELRGAKVARRARKHAGWNQRHGNRAAKAAPEFR